MPKTDAQVLYELAISGIHWPERIKPTEWEHVSEAEKLRWYNLARSFILYLKEQEGGIKKCP